MPGLQKIIYIYLIAVAKRMVLNDLQTTLNYVKLSYYYIDHWRCSLEY